MKNKRKNAFTLVELLAVLVILAVILVIAIPKVISIIKDVRISTLESTAKLVALSAEKKKVENEIIGNNEILTCENVVKINDIDYENCYIEFINNKAVVTIIGKGTFKGMNACEATKNNANITERCLNKKVEVTLELNGGSAPDITGVYKEGTVIDLEEPIKENSTFTTYKVVSGNSVITNNKLTVGSTNTIIYAMYELWPSLEVDLDGGSDNTDYKEKYKSGTILELEVPTKDKYTFTGWKVIEGNSVLSGNNLTMGSEDTVIKAEWEINVHKLNVNLDDGKINQQFENEYIEGESIELQIPTKEGYTFNGWIVEGNGASVNDNILTIGKEDTSIKAIWKANTYKVAFNSGDGTISTSYKNVTYNNTYGEMPTATKTGYMFVGWYNNDNKEVISTDKVEILNDIELTAKYVKNEFTYIGNYETFTVPKDGNYKIELWGAQGGPNDIETMLHGGKGAYVSGEISLTSNTRLYVYVGNYGYKPSNLLKPFNGGGAPDTTGTWESSYTGEYSGGGATDIRLVSGEWDNFDSLKSRIIVAAGGAGGNNQDGTYGGAGGGIVGISNHEFVGVPSQTTGYSFGIGQDSGVYPNKIVASDGNEVTIGADTGPGGGGYYGGFRGYNHDSGGSGGTSFISGHNGCNAIKEESTKTNIVHSGQSIHYSNYKFTNTIMIDGDGYKWTNVRGNYTGMPSYDGKTIINGNTGNGYAKITYIG